MNTRLLTALILSSYAFAQTPTATVVGRVLDASEAAVPGAAVQIRNNATTETRRAQSGATGEFTVPNLAPGLYEVSVEAAGFRSIVQKNVELQIDQTARLDFHLQIGTVSESVEVKAEA